MRNLTAFLLVVVLSACVTPPPPPPVHPPVMTPRPPLKIGLALGGGAARGFAHIGVIKALEAQGIVPDVIVGSSAGSVVGALYASGMSGFEMQKLALELQEDMVTDWTLPNRGVLKGEALQDFINQRVRNLSIQKMPKPLGVVATDLQSGEMILFRAGNTGVAVRASSALPGVFQPVEISGRDYVDGGLTSPVPAQSARAMGADFVIAVDLSNVARRGKLLGTMDVMLQTFAVMGHTISTYEMKNADVVVRPITAAVSSTSFEDRHLAILEGEKAVATIMPELKAKLARARTRQAAAMP
ncbi:MAG: patatin-like phospholipase family protein [Thiobacillus sp.]|nr:patatin-like phospholipase family protein [Thiobacillus sp.]